MNDQKVGYLVIAVSMLGICCVFAWVIMLFVMSNRLPGLGGSARATLAIPTALPRSTLPPLFEPTATPPPVQQPVASPSPISDAILPTNTPLLPFTITTEETGQKTPQPAQKETEAPKPSPQFVYDDIQRTDGACGVFGYVRDANGQPLEGVRITTFNEWGWKLELPAISKPISATDAGYYDIILAVAAGKWTVQVIDETGFPISNQAIFTHSEEFSNCHYVINWRRAS